MSTVSATRSIRWDSWELSAEADRRFRFIVLAVAAPIAILAVVMQLWDFREHKRAEAGFDSTQYVQLLPEQAEPAAPSAEEKTAENVKEVPQEAKPVKPEVKPDKKPTPVTPPTKSARDVAAKSGVLQFADQLADLRDQNVSAITTQPTLNNTITSKGGIGAASGGSPDAIASSAAAGSGGIGSTSDLTSVQVASSLGSRTTAKVKSPLGTGIDKSKAGQSGDRLASSRSLNEIKLTFDKNAGPFYAIFNRAARENAGIGRGTIRVNLTIAPSGQVMSCSLVSSTFNDSEFERKVVERVKLLNFGAKDAPVFTTDYPIYFIPQ